ncbi:MAG TPA: hypothetical protein VFV95_05460 [Vicinamibacterales bacterium]|nr:hypothetical protein [Vicinamibacterales bacterium]
MRTALLIYLAGVLIGLWKVDAPGVRRVALAMAWPLGVVAAVITVAILLTAALVLFPLVAAMAGIGGLLAWKYFA